MATEFKLNYTGSEINQKLADVDMIKTDLENSYYTSDEIDIKFTENDSKFDEVNEGINAKISEVNTSLNAKADIVDGKVPVEQIPDGIVDLSSYYTKEESNASLTLKADLVDGKIPAEQLPDDIGGGLTEVAWEDIQNKPFGEEGFQIEWDKTITDEYVEVAALGGSKWCKVYDYIEKTEVIGATLKTSDGESVLSDTDLMDYNEYCYGISGNPYFFITSQETTISAFGTEISFTSAGVWFIISPDGETYAYYLGKGEIKKIDKKFLPDDIGGGVTSWNDLEDKPFYESGFHIEWDTNPTDTFVPIEGSDGFYKVSDIVLTKDELIGATLKAEMDGEHVDTVLTDSDIIDYSADCYGFADAPFFVVTTQATEFDFLGQLPLSFPSPGVWFIYSSGITWTYYLGKGELKQLDPKFIPNYFGEVGTKIEWDGTPTDVYETFDAGGALGYFYKVAEPVDTIINGTVYIIQADGEVEQTLGSDAVQVTNGGENGIYIMNVKVPNSVFAHPSGVDITFREVGLYFFYANIDGQEVKITSFTSSDYSIKQIDKKYIPDDIVASVSLTFDETPTEGSQNPVKSMGIHSAISALEGKITSTFCYKGTVENYADLPSSDNTVGDVWNIANADEANGVNAGDNAAWNGAGWDILAGVIDLSDYYTKTEIDSIALNGTVNLANYYTKAETYSKSEIDDMIGDCDSIINSINTLVGGGSV